MGWNCDGTKERHKKKKEKGALHQRQLRRLNSNVGRTYFTRGRTVLPGVICYLPYFVLRLTRGFCTDANPRRGKYLKGEKISYRETFIGM
ncbi:hypothetical protein AALO_G00113650 [Alosa alosa]|uniref:Uncharacterized protein n=1 Tax=Alosa alosa TaxID=278164 RepID=A0AAV6GTE0_9TELE|nr:hypothetical protein AALO_G00113650 [Alosa alosa]